MHMISFLPTAQAAKELYSLFSDVSLPKHRFCDFTGYNTWLWGEYLDAELLTVEGTKVLFRRMMDGTPTSTAISSCPFFEEELLRLSALAKAKGHPLCLFPLSEEEKEELLCRYPGAVAETSPDWRDYLYQASDLATFRGKKYNGQRNHLNRFRALYPEGTCVEICDQNRQMALDFLSSFYGENQSNPPVESEKKRLIALIETARFDGSDGLWGKVLTAEGKVVALSIGEVVGDTLFVHAEKALRDCRGAYQAVVSGFISPFLAMGVQFVNREEDDGNEGLRTSKLSYHPVSLLEKWRVFLPSLEK